MAIKEEKTIDKTAFLALDIGTEFVKALIAKPSKTKGELEIMGIGKAKQEPTNMHAGAIADIDGCLATCEQAIATAEKQAGFTVQKAVVGIAGELVKGKTSTIHYRRQNAGRPLSDQEMQLILEKVQKKTGAEAQAAIALESGNPDVEARLINSAVVSLTIDGYRISNPIGFKGHELQIQIYTAFAPLVHISAIEKVCSELNLDLIAVAVEPFAACRACLGEDPDTKFSAVIIDIGSGTTDVAVVADGGIEGTQTFSIGGRVIEKNLSVWLQGVEIALSEFSTPEILPGRILLCGGGAEIFELQEALATEDWYAELPFARRPLVELADSAEMPGFINSTNQKLDCGFITALGLLRVGFDTEQGTPTPSLRDKLAKLLQN